MLNLRSSCKFLRTFCVLLAAWMAMEISCLAQAQPAEENEAFDPSYFDPKLFFALGMIESGNNDRGIGRGRVADGIGRKRLLAQQPGCYHAKQERRTTQSEREKEGGYFHAAKSSIAG